jgi:hypothetical protein
VNGAPCATPASASKKLLDALVVDEFIEVYGEISWDDELLVDEDDAPLVARLEEAERSLNLWLKHSDDLLEVDATAYRQEMASRVEARDQARDELFQARAETGRRRQQRPINITNIGDVFEPGGPFEYSLPDQRRLLDAGIEQVVVDPGKRPLKERVKVVFPAAETRRGSPTANSAT